LLAGEIKDFPSDRTNDDVEEPGDGTCSGLFTQKVVALNDIGFVEQNCYWDGSLVKYVPLCEEQLASESK
jgi:hypothetical protein